jgi:hypothetical protein
MKKYEFGQLVEVKEFGGDILTRIVVSDVGPTVIVCVESEFSTAQRERRIPNGVGFPRCDVTPLQQ